MTEQEREILTIKERNFKLKLSDADCKRLFNTAAVNGLTIAELLESFIGDLVNGTYSNGSDERKKAQAWLDRCGYSMTKEATFLTYLLEWDEIEDFIECLEYEEEVKEDIESFKETAEDTPDDNEILENMHKELKAVQRDIKEYFELYQNRRSNAQDYEEALAEVLKYKADLEALLDD